jgi:sensor histidine kinase YesM
MNKKKAYWICQLGGWLFFVFLNSIFIKLNNAFNARIALSMLLFFVLGFSFTQFYRYVIIQLGWLRLKVIEQIPRVILSVTLLSIALEYTQFGIESVLHIQGSKHLSTVDVVTNIINQSFVLSFWSLIYFLFHYIENYKKSEIENLKWQASINEIELNKLKSQLNPHFMFNAMNSIRALIDENPTKSKEAITQLSNILRNTLQMGKNKVIPFDEEMKIVNDYLSLEKIRYEERLQTKIELHKESSLFMLPPLMIQTLVENAIKHGILKLTAGGTLKLSTLVKENKLHIIISNDGQLQVDVESESGFGIKNTEQRLQLLYGNEASFELKNQTNNTVVAQLIIPHTLSEF